MPSHRTPKESLTGVQLSVRRAYGQWRDVAVMRLSDAQVDEIRQGNLPEYSGDPLDVDVDSGSVEFVR